MKNKFAKHSLGILETKFCIVKRIVAVAFTVRFWICISGEECVRRPKVNWRLNGGGGIGRHWPPGCASKQCKCNTPAPGPRPGPAQRCAAWTHFRPRLAEKSYSILDLGVKKEQLGEIHIFAVTRRVFGSAEKEATEVINEACWCCFIICHRK